MSAPTVMRPSASVSEDPNKAGSTTPDVEWSKYVKWGLIAALTLTAIGLIVSVYITYTEKSHVEKLKGEWDAYHNAIFEKKSDDERIEALEKVADDPKVKGTAVHAFVLSSLAHANFEMAQNPRRQMESRRDSLERTIALNKMLAETEPFKSNPLFGPIAVQNLASAYEQKQVNEPKSTQFYDEAIKTLRASLFKSDAKDADPNESMKKHFLFNKMNAQLGRMYWLRGLRKIELDPKNSVDAAKSDYEFALFYVKAALESGISQVEKDRFGTDFKGAWREEAAYIKSLLDPVGKMMPGGVAPAMKIESKESVSIAAAPTGATATATAATITTSTPHTFVVGDKVTIEGVAVAGYNGTFPVTAVPSPNSFTFAVTAALAASGGGTAKVIGDTKKVEVKKDEPKKDETKKEEPKKDETKKEEPKKTGSLNRAAQESMASNSDAPSQHMSYAQIQALLKQGRPALCQCPRCASSDKAIGAKLEE